MINNIPNNYVCAKIKINASTDILWKSISKPGNLEYCHPFCKSNKVEKWGEIGAIDFIEYYNGLCLKRYFIEWNEGEGYELLIKKKERAFAKVKWEITAHNKNESFLKIHINLVPSAIFRKYPKFLTALISKLYLLPTMKKYVQSVVKGFKYNIETGECVRLNQFGFNKMFSVLNQ